MKYLTERQRRDLRSSFGLDPNNRRKWSLVEIAQRLGIFEPNVSHTLKRDIAACHRLYEQQPSQ